MFLRQEKPKPLRKENNKLPNHLRVSLVRPSHRRNAAGRRSASHIVTGYYTRLNDEQDIYENVYRSFATSHEIISHAKGRYYVLMQYRKKRSHSNAQLVNSNYCLSATFRLEFSARCDKMLPSNREGIACCRPIFRPTCQASRRGSAQTSSVGTIFSRRAGRKVSVARAAAMSTPIVTRSV